MHISCSPADFNDMKSSRKLAHDSSVLKEMHVGIVTQPEITKHENEYHLKSVSQVAVSPPSRRGQMGHRSEPNCRACISLNLLRMLRKMREKMSPEDIRSSSSSEKGYKCSWMPSPWFQETASLRIYKYEKRFFSGKRQSELPRKKYLEAINHRLVRCAHLHPDRCVLMQQTTPVRN